MKRRRNVVEHRIIVRVAEGVNTVVFVNAPKNTPRWKLTQIAAVRLGLLDKKSKRGQ